MASISPLESRAMTKPEGYDGWILGLSAPGDGRLLVSGDTCDTAHDVGPATRAPCGRRVRQFGLACVGPR
jgi:hypothetical protein